jgi:hypothetical protein
MEYVSRAELSNTASVKTYYVMKTNYMLYLLYLISSVGHVYCPSSGGIHGSWPGHDVTRSILTRPAASQHKCITRPNCCTYTRTVNPS